MNTRTKKRAKKTITPIEQSASIDFNPTKKRTEAKEKSDFTEHHMKEFEINTAPKAKRGRKPKPKPFEYEVFHSMGDFFYVALGTARACRDADLVEAFLDGKYASVFVSKIPDHFPVDVEHQLERIFDETQNLDEAWNPPNRSTSVGDIVRIDDDFWVVASVGWRLLEMPKAILKELKARAS